MKVIAFVYLLSAVVWLSGCDMSASHPDPIAGWKQDFQNQPDQTIVSDYQEYIQKLSPDEKLHARVNDWREDGSGQHAIVIEIALNGTWWHHVLIYDKNDKRIKTTKYITGHYAS